LGLVTSREEGGSKALPECMATGVPVVTKRAGIALDVIKHNVNRLIIDVEDVDGVVRAASKLIDVVDFRHRVVKNASQTIKDCDWSVIARRYYEQVYAALSGQR